jgi:hypothetical protein
VGYPGVNYVIMIRTKEYQLDLGKLWFKDNELKYFWLDPIYFDAQKLSADQFASEILKNYPLPQTKCGALFQMLSCTKGARGPAGETVNVGTVVEVFVPAPSAAPAPPKPKFD